MEQNEVERKTEIENQFFAVLNNRLISTVFQPIVSLRDGTVHGYEALSRGPVNTEMQSPSVLFEYANTYDKLLELEYLCRSTAFKALHSLQSDIRLFLNVNPNIMHDAEFKKGITKESLERYSINPENIIFEITEREAVINLTDFIKTVQNYKTQNYKIAIDDAGAGYCGLNLISDIHPHYIKLDMNLIRNVDKDFTKQSLIASMCEFASLTNTALIAEGIETENELLKCIELGINYGQGYYIQRPLCTIIPIKEDVIYTIYEANNKKNHLFGNRISDIYISNISRSLKTINSGITVSQIYEIMKDDYTLPGICVTEDDFVVGVITRNELFSRMSGRYGYNLYSNKAIKIIMSENFLCVDYQTTIDSVAKKAMQRESDKIYDFIVVTKGNKYHGIVTVKDLLEKSIEIEVINARHLNPLSELPGNLLIEQQLEMCIDSKIECQILYFDINNFKAYNDVYGFENGDRLLKCLTRILRIHIAKDDFIGHIGGDDFIAILKGNNAEDMCKKIIKDFDHSIEQFYNQDHLQKGCIIAKNRYGIEECFPLLSISVVAVSNHKYQSIFDLSEDMAKMKKLCKQKVGSSYIISSS